MSDTTKEALQKAREYAFLLLKFRPRSEKEICERLKKKKFDEHVIRETISFLREKGFINDSDFARAWIESRLKRPLGIRRIKEELKLKGIDQEIIEQQLEELSKGYSEEEIVTKIAQEKINKLKDIEPNKAKRRIFAYLVHRGFSPEVIIDVISQLRQ